MAKHPISNSSDLNNSNGDPQSMEKLKQAAGYIIGAILLALAGYFGWTYFQNSGMKEDTVAADKYAAIEKTNDELMGQPEGNADVSKKLNADIDKLVAEHGNTVYAWQALMIKSRNAVDANDMKTATEALKKALEIDLKDPGLHSITQLRYATVLLADGNVDEALTQASKDVPVAFEASQQEILGDIYSAKKDKEKALRAYQNAWSLLSKRHEERPFLRLKLENLGINPEPIEPADQIVDVAALQQSQDASQAQSNAELEAVAAELAGGSSEGTAQ
ncbi:YfgM family protein [Psychrobacter sanguinis]|uniref:YfgM family protein n=1 Tax=Psychrobacter sanguinis TaxID=861445 RepID=UPI001919FA2F|nr:tetratricopeptide repeat protein [Psychrobacter sanguinis]MCC3345185.1 tetratricopeptide repeat protein [Psychrobacter sanguinis]